MGSIFHWVHLFLSNLAPTPTLCDHPDSPWLEIDNVTYYAGATSVPKPKCFLLLWKISHFSIMVCDIYRKSRWHFCYSTQIAPVEKKTPFWNTMVSQHSVRSTNQNMPCGTINSNTSIPLGETLIFNSLKPNTAFKIYQLFCI